MIYKEYKQGFDLSHQLLVQNQCICQQKFINDFFQPDRDTLVVKVAVVKLTVFTPFAKAQTSLQLMLP